ncbi:unnamed protein product [Peronospora belbahrii]|uniref:Uncharacterized protein n=1 Tax=Peronospora belbahrii TaxID=622444 RepID=A0AAU9LIW0_9STRA|nr:unnamed protein product [Peronospora belbahrii]CAH0521833.1 unnamed protein product [Peronospora belbahrii]
MIIRAASDSDSDDGLLRTDQAVASSRRSVFDPPDVDSTSLKGSTTRYTWFAACGALILLLLVDVAAVFNPSPDVFALLPMLVSSILYNEAIMLPPTASFLNQFMGLGLVAVWIYSREKSVASGDTSPWFCNARYGMWTVGALLLLGHVVSCFYLLFALLESNGDRAKLWLGRKNCKRYRTGPYGRA